MSAKKRFLGMICKNESKMRHFQSLYFRLKIGNVGQIRVSKTYVTPLISPNQNTCAKIQNYFTKTQKTDRGGRFFTAGPDSRVSCGDQCSFGVTLTNLNMTCLNCFWKLNYLLPENRSEALSFSVEFTCPLSAKRPVCEFCLLFLRAILWLRDQKL